ncbi:hypothetical protein [Desulforhopalus sp. IMCC35007]|uniref:hypothetical protein n=1 Tax=Desulforhopalus sp. IMCC35007 TaxID=2569543 RepID=UPI0010AEE50D|nr:hypothetical protein [Desulforhopalus sp. IMCC35007]TKB07678.1 hypothetical protein FCL48_16775 [Desulforhopalus sp. IMCC35007]
MEAEWINENLKADDTFTTEKIELLYGLVFDKTVNPALKKQIAEKDILKAKTSTEIVVCNLIKNREKITIVDSFDKQFPAGARSPAMEQRVIYYLADEKRGFINLDKAPSNKERKAIRELWGEMELEQYKEENGKWKKSRIFLTEKGLKQFSKFNDIEDDIIIRQEKVEDEIFINHKNDDGTVKRVPKIRIRKERKHFTPEEQVLLVPMIKDLEAYRILLSRFNATCTDIETGKTLELNDLPRRIFNKDHNYGLTRGGRYYSKVARIWKENRKTMLINGNATVELDYGCCLPSILAANCGVKLPEGFDIYSTMPGYNETHRDLFKQIVVIMLGAKSQQGLKQALSRKYKDAEEGNLDEDGYLVEKFYPDEFTKDDIKKAADVAVERFCKYFPLFEEKLFREDDLISLELQNTEAKIATKIINKFVAAGKPIFCIHDSFRVLKDDENLLRDTMYEAYFEVVKRPPLSIK